MTGGLESRSWGGSVLPPAPRKPTRKHFGETLRASKYSHRLKRDEYALPNKTNTTRLPREYFTEEQWEAHAWMYEDDDHRICSDEFCRLQHEAALETFDLNKAFFRKLSGKDFMAALDGLLAKHKNLRNVTDLGTLDGVEGSTSWCLTSTNRPI